MRKEEGDVVNGVVVSIHIALEASARVVSKTEVRAVVGKGLDGDRYFKQAGTYSTKDRKPAQEVTLIEIEAVEALKRDYGIEIDPGESRRNVVTRGVALNHLVGREFQIGNVRMRGVRLCEPCEHVEALSKPGVRGGLIHRGGLRAQVLSDGMIRVGDPVEG